MHSCVGGYHVLTGSGTCCLDVNVLTLWLDFSRSILSQNEETLSSSCSFVTASPSCVTAKYKEFQFHKLCDDL